ncbi:MAG: hypothetical protein QF473_18685 [Planctomycetota bacterium]|nr:hypothetical protein [Planctomycetota bacterium]
MTFSPGLRRMMLPIGVFMGTFLLHLAWVTVFYEGRDTQQRFVAVPGQPSALGSYRESGEYWLGYSYALSLAFAMWALRSYREQRTCKTGGVAIGGFTLSSFLAVAGCYLAGCCGSPMLAVYLSLFGAAFLPFAKPLVALATTLTIAAGWWWLSRRGKSRSLGSETVCAPQCIHD